MRMRVWLRRRIRRLLARHGYVPLEQSKVAIMRKFRFVLRDPEGMRDIEVRALGGEITLEDRLPDAVYVDQFVDAVWPPALDRHLHVCVRLTAEGYDRLLWVCQQRYQEELFRG